ncbi:hypothetical protein [Acinetobacter phage ABPH49]|nr:hypothetical protein [Acinetobacter phage ABPH49]
MTSRNVVSGVSFWYSKQTYDLSKKGVVAYKPLLSGSGFESLFEDLNVGNSYYAMMFGGQTPTNIGSSSKIVIRNIVGAPIGRGLSLDRCLDIPRISDIHWNYNIYLGKENEYAQDLKQWIFDNATGFHFGRVDFAAAFRLFCFGYKIAYYFRSERYNGSSDSFRLVECDADICSRPIFAQNYGGVFVVDGGKFTGASAGTLGLVETDLSGCLFYQTSPASQVVLNNATFNNLSGDAISFGSHIRVSNCKFYNVGKAGTQRAVFRARSGANSDVHLQGVEIQLSLDNSRGVWSDDSTGTLTMSGGTTITGVGFEGYRWAGGGKVTIDSTCRVDIRSRSSGSWHTTANSVLFSEQMPTVGSFYKAGDFVFSSKPTALGLTTPANYAVIGWSRATNSNADGTNHAVNVDWFEVKAFIDQVARSIPMSGQTRPTTGPEGMIFFDKVLGIPICLKSNSPMSWIKMDGTPA